MYRAWFSPASFAQRVEFVDVPGGFRYALGTVLGYKSAVLVEDLDLGMGLVELLQAHAAIDIEHSEVCFSVGLVDRQYSLVYGGVRRILRLFE